MNCNIFRNMCKTNEAHFDLPIKDFLNSKIDEEHLLFRENGYYSNSGDRTIKNKVRDIVLEWHRFKWEIEDRPLQTENLW